MMISHTLPISCYERLIPPPWIWATRLMTPDEEEALYASAIRRRLYQAYAALARLETSLWHGRSIAYSPGFSEGESAYVTALYYTREGSVNINLSGDPYRLWSLHMVLRCIYLHQLEEILDNLIFPVPQAHAVPLFASDVLQQLDGAASDARKDEDHRVPLTRDLYYSDQLVIKPRTCW